jgi:hypothetical protein
MDRQSRLNIWGYWCVTYSFYFYIFSYCMEYPVNMGTNIIERKWNEKLKNTKLC